MHISENFYLARAHHLSMSKEKFFIACVLILTELMEIIHVVRLRELERGRAWSLMQL
jgi:hypothetical protein